jgi:hypothetical protein
MMNKEKDVVGYIVELELDRETPDTLYRYIQNEEGYRCEAMNEISDGEWYEDNGATSLQTETHSGYHYRANKEEAEKIAAQLGGSIYND